MFWFICASVNIGREFIRAKTNLVRFIGNIEPGCNHLCGKKRVFKGEVMAKKEDECGCLHLM